MSCKFSIFPHWETSQLWPRACHIQNKLDNVPGRRNVIAIETEKPHAIHKEFSMKNSSFESAIILVSDTTELVRGQEQKFLEQIMPRVRRQSVALNLESVDRIDAAGLAALVTLYCESCKAGNSFTVSHPCRRVREILELVGLDRILVRESEVERCFESALLQESAA
jgi:anti-anti-sigma factor